MSSITSTTPSAAVTALLFNTVIDTQFGFFFIFLIQAVITLKNLPVGKKR